MIKFEDYINPEVWENIREELYESQLQELEFAIKAFALDKVRESVGLPPLFNVS